MASEHFYFWLNSLKEFSQAEQYLSHVEDGDYSGAMSAIAEALRSYQKGIASLTVSLTARHLLVKKHYCSSSFTSDRMLKAADSQSGESFLLERISQQLFIY